MSKPSNLWQSNSGFLNTSSAREPKKKTTLNRSANADQSLPPLPPPPPSSSLPNSYEIPTLRKPNSDPANTSPSRHNRSVSHPFPLFFGGKRTDKKNSQRNDDVDSSDSSSPSRKAAQQPQAGSTRKKDSTPQADRLPVTGKCMTCDSTVRWPQGLKVFRCTTCLTVNDLEPCEEQYSNEDGDRSLLSKKAAAVSIEKTRRLIDHCMNEYLSQQLQGGLDDHTPRVEDETPRTSREHVAVPAEHVTELQLSGTVPYTIPKQRSESEPQLDMVRPPSDFSRIGDQRHAANSPSRPSTVHHRPRIQEVSDPLQYSSITNPSARDASWNVFRPLESYISGAFTGCTALNISFFSVKSSSEGSSRLESEIQRHQPKPTEVIVASQSESDPFISELDAKTLLLGDVVENGSWWTGNRAPKTQPNDGHRERSPERWKGIVSAKTPRINWVELADWYRLIIYAGSDWQKRWASLQPDGSSPAYKGWQSVSLQRLQYEVIESQLRLQRTLLKATENLLKRPRRPLKTPEDCRFLLMLLANPLLGPTSGRPIPVRSQDSSRDHTRQRSGMAFGVPASPTKAPLATERSGALGHHSGIIKRILGLASHLPNEVHQFFVSWMSRFSDGHFQRLVDMTSSFVTYRLSKRQDRSVNEPINPTEGLVPSFSDSGVRHASQLHAALEIRPPTSSKGGKKADSKPKLGMYSEDWQVRAAARFMALLFQANAGHLARKRDISISYEQRSQHAGLNAKHQANTHGQIVPISTFYNTLLDHADLIGDFEAWETTKTRFTFCQYPFFLSIWAKIHILEHDARRQMEVKAREAFFDSILSRKAVSQYLVLKVRRDCLVEDSLKNVSEVVGSGGSDIKKGLRIDFVGEEGIDAGGLRKEWFLLLVREIFDPHHGLFLYDEDSRYCYFNPFCFESSEQFFLVGVLLGLAIYNSTILDVAFPPFVFKKMLASAPPTTDKLTSTPKITPSYTLEDLAEYRPALAKGLRQMLDFDGDVQEVFCRDFVVEMDKYGETIQVPLCPNGHKRSVTNSNRREFVDLYIRYMLDTAVTRQYEPFKRGFFTVCGGNALSLFRPEEIELLIRGSDEPLDINSLRAVATYDNWPKEAGPADQQPQVLWFWQTFERASPANQHKMLTFITGSDRIPAMGATNLTIRLQCIRDKEAEIAGTEIGRFPSARTCFNTLSLYKYQKRKTLESKLWMAVMESEGFGLK